MIAGPRTVQRSSRAPGSIDHAAVDLGVDQLALDAALDRVEHEPVGGEHVLEAAGVLPPAADDVRLDPHPVVDEVLDRVGDLELAAGRTARSPGRRRGPRR